MAQVYFHCTSTRGVQLDRRGANADDLIEAHQHATRMVQSLITTPNAEDWRKWVLHVSDEQGDEIFVMPFSLMLGKPH
jgi:hypothetical protein